MARAEKLYKDYFLEYASYVIRDRAIPDLLDGFKPVQRRILHTMISIDDGRFNKVAGVVGECMKYHPHGDSSIYGALVNIENDGLFIEGQGNYGNILTGDSAAAARYIECRLKPFAKKVLYSPEITEYVDSYDGRNKEPVVFQAKVPVVAITGTSGIAVGMSTKILPHNYTAEKANIEICWQRNVYSEDMVDLLYATTDCQKKISVNPLVIVDGLPKVVGISEQIKFHADHLVETLRKELNIEMGHLRDKLRARTLERIFIEERIYKRIESKESAEAVEKAVVTGFKPFISEIGDILPTHDDVERLLKIPIRRISLFDIEKNREEIRQIEADINQCQHRLDNIIDYAVDFISELEGMFDPAIYGRKSEIGQIEHKSAKEVAVRNMDVRYDPETGYLGTNVKTGDSLLKISTYDRIFYMKNNGEYRVTTITDKIFVGKEGIFDIDIGEKEVVAKKIFTMIYRDKVGDRKLWMIKRFQISAFSVDKTYITVPEKAKIKKICLYPSAIIHVKYKEGMKYRVLEEDFRFADFKILKSSAGQGNQLTTKELEKLVIKQTKDTKTSLEAEPTLFD